MSGWDYDIHNLRAEQEKRDREALEERRHQELLRASSSNWFGYALMFIAFGGGGGLMMHGGGGGGLLVIVALLAGLVALFVWLPPKGRWILGAVLVALVLFLHGGIVEMIFAPIMIAATVALFLWSDRS